jgi:hypothetical protein
MHAPVSKIRLRKAQDSEENLLHAEYACGKEIFTAHASEDIDNKNSMWSHRRGMWLNKDSILTRTRQDNRTAREGSSVIGWIRST